MDNVCKFRIQVLFNGEWTYWDREVRTQEQVDAWFATRSSKRGERFRAVIFEV